MFLIMGFSTEEKPLEFEQTIVCYKCGRYGRYSILATYKQFTLFFIPIVKWDRSYVVTSSCCGAVYDLDVTIGRRIEKGESVEIKGKHLTERQKDRFHTRCGECGFLIEDDRFEFCPICGTKL